MAISFKSIEAKDCCVISVSADLHNVLFYFVTVVQPTVHHFFVTRKDEEPIIYYDFRLKQWLANRYIGECRFHYQGTEYMLKISPRFGDRAILKLFEYIYSVKLPPSYHTLQNARGLDVHKLFITIVWISYFKRASRHGLLKEKVSRTAFDNAIKGGLLIRESLVSAKTKCQVKYRYEEKIVENIPNRILHKAYQLLKKDNHLTLSLLPKSLRGYLAVIGQLCDPNAAITEQDYQNIEYNSIYSSYRPLIDFSWTIIKSKDVSINTSDKLDRSFFLDMAEVWENFVLRIASRHLTGDQWKLSENKFSIYESKFYKRTIIPDIVLQDARRVLVLDAKYKLMGYATRDVDREDLFQIHTYSYYFDHKDKQVISGLIYPFSQVSKDEENHHLFDNAAHKSLFFVGGIEMLDEVEMDHAISKFVNSIQSLVNRT